MQEKFDPSLPIKVLFAQMDKVQDLATASENTYTDAQMVSIAFDLIFSSGVHANACKEWIQQPRTAQTWTGFKPQFTQAHQLLHEMQMSAAQAGYTANSVFADNDINEMAEAIAQLAGVTQNDQTIVADLAASSSTLMEQVANMTTHLSDKDSEIASLQLSIDKLTITIHNLGSVPTKSKQQGNTISANPKQQAKPKVSICYCWTCGANTTHNGKDCHSK
eukprot:7381880-Ditylum_brightwellii.AAC.2